MPPIKEKRRKMSSSTIAIIALSFLLVASIGVAVTLAFFAANRTAAGNITLGDPVDINITQGGTTVSTLTFEGKAMPGTVYNQVIGVTAPAATSDAVLRARIQIANEGDAAYVVDATTSTDWVEGEDDFFYYNGIISAGESVGFINTLTVPTELTNDDANKVFTLTITVEALQHANGAASSVWTTAPQTWLTDYGSGTVPNP